MPYDELLATRIRAALGPSRRGLKSPAQRESPLKRTSRL